MKRRIKLIVLFIYIQFNKLFIESTLVESGEFPYDSSRVTRSSTFDSVKSSLGGVFTHVDNNENENLNQNIGVKLDLNDIDLESFTVKDDNYRGYFTKNIKIKTPKGVVTIVDGNTFIHVPRNYEKFIQCTLTSNENYHQLKYDYMNSDKMRESLVFYKKNDRWYDSESNSLSEFTDKIFDSKYNSLDRNLLNRSEESNDGMEILHFNNSIDGLYIKFDLDINVKREDEMVDFRECVFHGNQSYIYIVKNGYRVNRILEGEDEVCVIEEGQRCFYSQIFELDDNRKVMFILNNKKDEVVKNHYEKVDGTWKSISLDEFYTKFLEAKKYQVANKNIDLDIRTRNDTDEVLFIDSDFDNVHTHIYAPKLGFSFNKIRIKDYTIWNKRKNECQMVLVRFLDNFPYYIQLMMPRGVSDEFYYMKKKFIKDVVRKFKGTKYDGIWNKIDENKYSSGIAPLKMKPPIKLKSNKFILDINGRKNNDIYMYRHCYPMGLNSYIYLPKDGYKLAIIKDGDKKIWRAPSSEFGSFVFVILSNNEPYLVDVVAFDHNIESKHYYFKKLEGIWSRINGKEFNKQRNELSKILDNMNNSNDRNMYVNLDLNISDKTKFVFLQYDFDGMDTIILIPNNGIKIGKVLYKGRRIWKRTIDDCGMVIARLNNGEPYFVNIVKPGNTSDEFFYLTTLKENTVQSNKWKKVEFDHLYAQIKKFRLKPYIQHSYKEYQLDINSKGGDGICYYKCGDFYNIPSCYYITKTGYAITKLVDGNKVLWRSRNGEYSPYVVVLFSKDQPKLIFVMVNKSTVEINETTSIYFKRKGDSWVPIYDDKEFIYKLNEIEVISKSAIEFEMDINQRKDDDKVVFFDDELGVRNVFLYFPRKDYRLVKLTDNNEIIWKTDSKKYMISVKSYLVNDKPYLIRVRYRHPEIRFKNFERVGSKWVEIDSHSYLVKTLTLNDVFFSEVNVIKSSLFNKSVTEIGSNYSDRMSEFEERTSISSDSDYINVVGSEYGFEEIGSDNLSVKSEESISSKDKLEKEERKYSGDSISSSSSSSSTSSIESESETTNNITNENKENSSSEDESDGDIIDFIDGDPSITPVESIFDAIKIKSDNRDNIDSINKLTKFRMENDNETVLNIIDINFNSFKFSDNMYKNILHRAVEVKYGYKVTKVVEGNLNIHKLKDDENLFRCVIYHKDGFPDLVDIFIQDLNKKLAYYIYAKREGVWVLTYIKRSDIMYRLYRWLSRPIKKYLTLDLVQFDDKNFEKEERGFARYMYKAISPKPEVLVTRVTYKHRIVHSLKIGQNLTWAFLYEMDPEHDVLDLFVTESNGTLVCYVYKRESSGWSLEYSNESNHTDPVVTSTKKFKEFVHHKLIDSCDISNDLMNPLEQEEVVLDLNTQEPSFEYELDNMECKMFKPKKHQRVNKILDENEEVVWESKNESKQLIASFLYKKEDNKLDGVTSGNKENKKQKLALYLFIVDYDGNVERIKYHRISDKWVSEEVLISEGKMDEVERDYELDKITNEEVLEYLDASFNCRFREEWEREEDVSGVKTENQIKEVVKGNEKQKELENNDVDKLEKKRKYSGDSISSSSSSSSTSSIESESETTNNITNENKENSSSSPKWILDLSNVNDNNFSERKSSVNGQDCTEVLPNPDVIVDRLVDKGELIYDLLKGETFLGYTICLDDLTNEFNITYDIKSIDGNIKTYHRKNSDADSDSIKSISTMSSDSYDRNKENNNNNSFYNIVGSHVINIANLRHNVCDITINFFRKNKVKRFKIKKEFNITRVFEGVKLIKVTKYGERILGGCIYYNKGPGIVVLKITSSINNIDQYVYYKVGKDWMLIENYEISKYLRKLYIEGGYINDSEVEQLIGE